MVAMRKGERFPKRVKISGTQADIDEGKCGDPNKCMIKLAIRRAIKCPHGYINVKANRISITRRPDYRERAFLSDIAARNMVLFDKDKSAVKPFVFWAEFQRHTNIVKRDREQVNAARRKRRAEGRPDKTYSLAKRIVGLASTVQF
jgi:hypothetical protein